MSESDTASAREGGLDAPTRYPLNQNNPEFRDESDLNRELERVFDICHGCRRCVSLCNAFPTLFDLVDESDTMEVDGVDVADYTKVVDQCYLCDLCYLTKCPYVPPHEWKVDFPHLMLRAKAIRFEKGDTRLRDRLITSTDMVGKVATKPLINRLVNAGKSSSAVRSMLDSGLGIHKQAWVPDYQCPTARSNHGVSIYDPVQSGGTDTRKEKLAADRKKVALFTTCYCNYNEPDIIDSLVKVLSHNDVEVVLPAREHCCGMPKLELGDLQSVARYKELNIPVLHDLVQAGYSIMAAVPSCVLMFRQELPLLFPEDEQVGTVADAFCDPFEFLFQLHKAGQFNTDFKHSLGDVSYHVACHQRVQNIGPKTRQILELITETRVQSIERCSGHDGTYGVKSESHGFANKIARPIVRQIEKQDPDYYGSDCPIAGHHIQNNLPGEKPAVHPIDLLRTAYGI